MCPMLNHGSTGITQKKGVFVGWFIHPETGELIMILAVKEKFGSMSQRKVLNLFYDCKIDAKNAKQVSESIQGLEGSFMRVDMIFGGSDIDKSLHEICCDRFPGFHCICTMKTVEISIKKGDFKEEVIFKCGKKEL